MLKDIPTKELVQELERRAGVETVKVEPYKDYKAPAVNGPAIILTVID